MPESKPVENAADTLASALRATLISPNESDSNGEDANIVDAMASASRRMASAIHRLGTNNAGTQLGAIEAHAMAVEKVPTAIDGHTAAVQQAGVDVRKGLMAIANAIRERTNKPDQVGEGSRHG